MDSSMQENDMSNLSIFQAAALNLKPYRPNKMINLLTGLIAGMLGGCSLAVLLGFREAYLFHGGSLNVISGPSNDEFESILGLPVIATIPRQQQRLMFHSST
jgi:capsular polysaccharide biosynthesis protein